MPENVSDTAPPCAHTHARLAVQVDWLINTLTHFYHHNLKGFEKNFDIVLKNVEHRVRLLKVGGQQDCDSGLVDDEHQDDHALQKMNMPVQAPLACVRLTVHEPAPKPTGLRVLLLT